MEWRRGRGEEWEEERKKERKKEECLTEKHTGPQVIIFFN